MQVRSATLVVLAVLTIVPAHAGGPQPVGRPILLGVSSAQTGQNSNVGIKLLKGSQGYFDQVNARGGVHGQPIELVVRDDRYEPEPALKNTFEFVAREDILFLFGYVGTPTLMRTMPLLNHHYNLRSLINLAPFTGAAPIRKYPHSDYVFSVRAAYEDEARALIGHLLAQGHRRIALLAQGDSFGKSGEVVLQKVLNEHGLTLACIARYRRNQATYVSMLDQVDIVRRSGATAAVAFATAGPASAFVRDLRLSGFDLPVATVSFTDGDAFLDAVVKAERLTHRTLSHQLISSQVVPAPACTERDPLATYCHSVPAAAHGFVSLEGYLNAMVATEAIRRAGAYPTRRQIIQALESLTGWDTGLGLKLDFGPNRHQALHRVWLFEASGGIWIPAKGAGLKTGKSSGASR